MTSSSGKSMSIDLLKILRQRCRISIALALVIFSLLFDFSVISATSCHFFEKTAKHELSAEIEHHEIAILPSGSRDLKEFREQRDTTRGNSAPPNTSLRPASPGQQLSIALPVFTEAASHSPIDPLHCLLLYTPRPPPSLI